mgnify:CR=1 FL=1
MRKIYKILIACVVFLGITTALYATTNIMPKEKFEIKKVAILGAGVFLVVQILFISYQTDKLEENTTKRLKEPEIKINENIDNIQNKIKKIEPIKKEYEEILEIGNIKENKIKDMLNSYEDNFYLLESENKPQEEKDLFSKINISKKIEEIPDNINFKSDITKKQSKFNSEVLKEKNKNNNSKKIDRRNNIKIVRERKKRNLNEKNIVNKMLKEKIEDGKIVEDSLIKEIAESKKRAKKIAKEIKKNKKTQDKK